MQLLVQTCLNLSKLVNTWLIIFFSSFRAIEIDIGNQVFYCNRAAAHSKMNNHYAAVEDCKRAIDMDPAYGKAYGRMGLAYACVDKHKEAIECFKKAIELEPENESYKSNMKLAQDKLSAAGGISTGPQPGGFPGKYLAYKY